ncbi:hypothetical protein BH23ACT9_BH23ACT9_10940 [soil metagenome]
MHTLHHRGPLEIAQAGGGGDFGGFDSGSSSSGGSSGSDSFSGDGSSIGYDTGTTADGTLGEALAFGAGLLGFIVLIVVVLGVLIHFTNGPNAQGPPAAPPDPRPRPQDDAARQRALAGIAGGDAAFDEESFLGRAAAAFVTTQDAWSEQDLRPCRAFISDGVHERFGLLIAMQQAEGLRNRMRDVRVVDRSIVAAGRDPQFDTIHVRITASAISYKESLTTGKRVGGNSDTIPITFAEVWSFVRRPGVQTRADVSVLEGSCPNCGAALHIVDRAECGSCGHHVNAGTHDWVLAEITQTSEWGKRASESLPGMRVLQEADPGLSVQHIEDRASVVFWRAMTAVYTRESAVLAPLMPPGATLPPRWDPSPGEYWHTPAVGAVEVVAVTPAVTPAAASEAGGATDTVEVLIRWSAHRATGKKASPVLHDQKTIYSHVLVLQRDTGVTSDITQAFASAGCRTCGAPLDAGSTAACRFCATPVNDGSTSWVLVAVRTHRPTPTRPTDAGHTGSV